MQQEYIICYLQVDTISISDANRYWGQCDAFISALVCTQRTLSVYLFIYVHYVQLVHTFERRRAKKEEGRKKKGAQSCIIHCARNAH